MRHALVFLAFCTLFILAVAHQDGASNPTDYLPVDPFPLALQAFAIILLLSLVSVAFVNRMSELQKKIVFVLVTVLVVGVTAYAGISTVYLNWISQSGGPVHWHADFEIWVCGEKVTHLVSSTDFSGRVGTPVLHHHNDYRIHVEGVVIQKQDVSLGEFFEAIGGDLSDSTEQNIRFLIPLDNGTIRTIQNGELCNGKPGHWKLFVQNSNTRGFEFQNELGEYVLSPHFETIITDGPGDLLKLTFDSEEP